MEKVTSQELDSLAKKENESFEVENPVVKEVVSEEKDDNYPIGHTFTFEKKAFGELLKALTV
ncbi:hypothetical protein AAAC51_06790 [Priestia megaterium]